MIRQALAEVLVLVIGIILFANILKHWEYQYNYTNELRMVGNHEKIKYIHIIIAKNHNKILNPIRVSTQIEAVHLQN